MIFDWTVSISSILTVAGFIVSGVSFVMMMRGDFKVLREEVRSSDERLSILVKNTDDNAKQRLESVQRVVEQMQMILGKLSDAGLAAARREGRFEVLEERLNILSHRLDNHITEAHK